MEALLHLRTSAPHILVLLCETETSVRDWDAEIAVVECCAEAGVHASSCRVSG
jgi:hypothetical protein